MAAPLTSSRLQRAEHYFAAYAVVLPDGVSLEDAMKPAYWAHVAEKLRQHDTIRIIPEAGAYFAEILVLSAGRGYANVALLRHIPLDDEAMAGDQGNDLVDVKWRGPHSKWSLVRKSDGAVLKDGLVEKVDAIREAAGYKLAA